MTEPESHPQRAFLSTTWLSDLLGHAISRDRGCITGWFGRVNPYSFDPRSIDFPAGAARFETGTPAIPSAYAAAAGLETLAAVDPKAIDAHVRRLAELAHDRLIRAIQELQRNRSLLYGPELQ